MKGKITMIISVGCTALILTMVMFTQFKTVEETDITALETMRETELRAELTSWKSKYEELELKIEERENKIEEYKNELQNDANSSTVLENEIKESEAYLGYTALQGEGIVVTLEDNDMFNIEYSDLLRLVNELNHAGAEAVSINDERIISMTDIAWVNYRIVLVNSKKISGPYFVKAIGDKKYLESALTIKGGFIDEINAAGKNISYLVDDNIIVPAYSGKQKLEYAKENIVDE